MFFISALVHVRHKCADKNDFSDSTTGIEEETCLCYTNELLRVMISITICAIRFGSDLWLASPAITALVDFELLQEAEFFLGR
jgi:hypothetical protein